MAHRAHRLSCSYEGNEGDCTCGASDSSCTNGVCVRIKFEWIGTGQKAADRPRQSCSNSGHPHASRRPRTEPISDRVATRSVEVFVRPDTVTAMLVPDADGETAELTTETPGQRANVGLEPATTDLPSWG
jgi:hypothetical protein